MMQKKIKVGIAGIGAIGGTVARALYQNQIAGIHLECISDPYKTMNAGVSNVDFTTLVERSDLIVECLPAHIVPELARVVFQKGKDIVFISSAALLVYPDILALHRQSTSRAYLPSGALAGLDGVRAMRNMGITQAHIASTKKPAGFDGAPYVIEKKIDLEKIKEKTKIFSGDAIDASRGFPANINVAATLSLAGIGPEKTQVEIWADPQARGNSHEIEVKTAYSTLSCRIENMPDPQNPKSSILAAQSILSTLADMTNALVIL